MKLSELFEGLMKRSDPVISGERTSYAPKSQKVSSAHEKKLEALAKEAGVSIEQARKAWAAAVAEVDPALSGRWAAVMARAKRALGL